MHRYLMTGLCLFFWGHQVISQGDGPSKVLVAKGHIQLNTQKWARGCDGFAAGGWHSLAIHPDGQAFAWGKNNDGQCEVPGGLGALSKVSAGFNHSCALTTSGNVVSWGNDEVEPPPALSQVSDLSSGRDFTCAVHAPSGTVTCWGENDSGQLDAPEDLEGVKSIHCGQSFVIAVHEDATFTAWGSNDYNQLVPPSDMPPYVHKIATGHNHALALAFNGEVWAWGRNLDLELAIPSNLGRVRSIAAGLAYSAALSDDTLRIWGRWNWPKPEYTRAERMKIRDIHGGAEHLIVEFLDGTFESWGSSEFGGNLDYVECLQIETVYPGLSHHALVDTSGDFVSLGNQESNQHLISSSVTGAISGGENFSLGIRNSGYLSKWGTYNGYINLSSDAGFERVSAGKYHAIALKGNGELHGMGFNNYGQISNLPSQALSATTTPNATAVVKTDGTLYVTGSHSWGSAPTDLPAMAIIDGCEDHLAGLTADGLLYAWGTSCGEACNNLSTDAFEQVHVLNGATISVRSDSSLFVAGEPSFLEINNWNRVHEIQSANNQLLAVIENNFAPYALVESLPDWIVCEGDSDSLRIDEFFEDREDEVLTFSLMNNNNGWSEISLNNNCIFLDASTPGTGDLTLQIVARDSEGLEATLDLVIEEKSNPKWAQPDLYLTTERIPECRAHFPIQHHSPLMVTIADIFVFGPSTENEDGFYDMDTPVLIPGTYRLSQLSDVHGCHSDDEYVLKFPVARSQ